MIPEYQQKRIETFLAGRRKEVRDDVHHIINDENFVYVPRLLEVFGKKLKFSEIYMGSCRAYTGSKHILLFVIGGVIDEIDNYENKSFIHSFSVQDKNNLYDKTIRLEKLTYLG